MSDSTSGQDKLNYAEISKRVEKSLTKHRFLAPYNTPRILSATFVRGMVFGVGSVIGAALIVIVIGFLIARLGGVPVLGQFLEKFGEALSQTH